MPAPKGRFPPARQNAVPEHTEPLRMSQCWMRRSEWPLKVAPETIDRRDGQPMCMIAWMRSKSPESQNLRFPRKRWAVNAYSWPHRKRCGDRPFAQKH
jgi:hypothetical protein